MVKAALKLWVNAGIFDNSIENINPVRLTNVVALLVIFVSFLQLPTAFYFWNDSSWPELYIVLFSIIALCFVPVLNAQQWYTSAALLLILTYVTDIVLSCLFWQVNVNIQHFLLLAMFVSPFLFSAEKHLLRLAILCCLGLLFVVIEIHFHLATMQLNLSQHQHVFRLSCASLLALASSLCSLHLWKNINRSWQKLATEKSRSEQLLLNILPFSIAQRLKHSPDLIADYFAQASILFADIQNFTPLCKKLSPQQLVSLLNEVFCVFDGLSQKYGLEKIKTSGDGYMLAGGLPTTSTIHATQCCQCALEMQAAFQIIGKKHNLKTGLRIGIGCGEVVAGIIGKSKFSYDLWGEAVNLASRMESHGVGNKIQITESTYQLTKEHFIFSKRGDIKIKGIGWVKTYWLVARKSNLESHVYA